MSKRNLNALKYFDWILIDYPYPILWHIFYWPYCLRIDRMHRWEDWITDISQVTEVTPARLILVKRIAVVNVVGVEFFDVLQQSNIRVAISIIISLNFFNLPFSETSLRLSETADPSVLRNKDWKRNHTWKRLQNLKRKSSDALALLYPRWER